MCKKNRKTPRMPWAKKTTIIILPCFCKPYYKAVIALCMVTLGINGHLTVCIIRLRKMMVLSKWKGLDYAAAYGFKNKGILLMGTIRLSSPVAYGLLLHS